MMYSLHVLTCKKNELEQEEERVKECTDSSKNNGNGTNELALKELHARILDIVSTIKLIEEKL